MESTRFRALRTLLLASAAAAPWATAEEASPVPGVPRSALSHLESAAREAAKAGRADAVSELVEILLRLGLDGEDAVRLNKRCGTALARAERGGKSDAPRAAAAIGRSVRLLERHLDEDELAEEERRALAEVIVRLDASGATLGGEGEEPARAPTREEEAAVDVLNELRDRAFGGRPPYGSGARRRRPG